MLKISTNYTQSLFLLIRKLLFVVFCVLFTKKIYFTILHNSRKSGGIINSFASSLSLPLPKSSSTTRSTCDCSYRSNTLANRFIRCRKTVMLFNLFITFEKNKVYPAPSIKFWRIIKSFARSRSMENVWGLIIWTRWKEQRALIIRLSRRHDSALYTREAELVWIGENVARFN